MNKILLKSLGLIILTSSLITILGLLMGIPKGSAYYNIMGLLNGGFIAWAHTLPAIEKSNEDKMR